MKTVLLFLTLFTTLNFQNLKVGFFRHDFDKTTYYHVLKKGSIKEINNQISVIDSSSLNNKDAFKGALLMKKAGLAGVPKQKLDYFKSGRIKLETALKEDSSNVEYHFLRLIIQEHAPKAVKYNNQLQEDADFIKKNFKGLPAEVQKIVINYSQTSKYLEPGDFN